MATKDPIPIKDNSLNGKSKYTKPQPFQLATDRRASLNSRNAETTSPKVPRTPRPGQVRASFSSPQIPPKPTPKPTTNPRPFNLQSIKRHSEAVEKMKEEIESKKKEEEKLRHFKAQPIAPPSPIAAPRHLPPTNAEGFTFLSEKRAEIRKEFNRKMDEKMTASEKEKQNSTTHSQVAQLEKEVKEYRKTLAFKATPMPSFYQGTGRRSLDGSSEKRITSRSLSPQSRRTQTRKVTSQMRSSSQASFRIPKKADAPQSDAPTSSAPASNGQAADAPNSNSQLDNTHA